jgi:hypothetical protein
MQPSASAERPPSRDQPGYAKRAGTLQHRPVFQATSGLQAAGQHLQAAFDARAAVHIGGRSGGVADIMGWTAGRQPIVGGHASSQQVRIDAAPAREVWSVKNSISKKKRI